MKTLRVLLAILLGAVLCGKEARIGVFFVLVDPGRKDAKEIGKIHGEVRDIFEKRAYGQWRMKVPLEGVEVASYEEAALRGFVEQNLQSDDSSYSLDELKDARSLGRAAEGLRQKSKLRYFRYFAQKTKDKSSGMRRAVVLIVVFYEENKTVDGMSFFGGAFTRENIGVVNLRRGETVRRRAEVIAHEMAHILGSSHDGDANACASSGSIMEIYRTPGEGKSLSACTVEYIRKKLETNAKALRGEIRTKESKDNFFVA